MWGRELAAATGVMVALAALGVLLGVLWQLVTPGAEILMTGDGPVHADSSAETYFADDGWFAVIGAVGGVLSALVVWLLVRRHRGPLLLVGTVAGCLLCAVVAWQVGRHIGLAEFQQVLDRAEPGDTFRRPARLGALGVLGLQGFTAAFTYTLLAGWSRWPLLRRPLPEEWPHWQGAWPSATTGYWPPGHGVPGHGSPGQGHGVPEPGVPGLGSPGLGGPGHGPPGYGGQVQEVPVPGHMPGSPEGGAPRPGATGPGAGPVAGPGAGPVAGPGAGPVAGPQGETGGSAPRGP
ncbi:MAG: DUF2567 domain-containing protein [Micromonosporaceae bacterium]